MGNCKCKSDNQVHKPAKDAAKVVASRKSCKASGAGLSHYILMDKKAK